MKTLKALSWVWIFSRCIRTRKCKSKCSLSSWKKFLE